MYIFAAHYSTTYMDITDTITKKEAHEIASKNTKLIQKNIYRILKEKNITQAELCLRIDMEESNLNYILRHPAARPGIERMGRIANKLGVEVIDLFRK